MFLIGDRVVFSSFLLFLGVYLSSSLYLLDVLLPFACLRTSWARPQEQPPAPRPVCGQPSAGGISGPHPLCWVRRVGQVCVSSCPAPLRRLLPASLALEEHRCSWTSSPPCVVYIEAGPSCVVYVKTCPPGLVRHVLVAYVETRSPGGVRRNVYM